MAKTFTNSEILDYLATSGTINLDSVRDDMTRHEKERAVAGYLHKIKKLNGKDGRWYIRVPDKTKKDGRRKIVAKTKEELVDKLYDWHCKTTGIRDGDITIASLYPDYVEYKMSTTWSESSRVYYQTVWDNRVSKYDIVNQPIKSITLTDLELWAYRIIKERSLTQKAWRNISTLIGGIFKYATSTLKVLDYNIYPDLHITNKAVFRQPPLKSPENLVVDPDQEIRIYATCWSYYEAGKYPQNRLLPLSIIFGFQTGLRPSEIVCLKKDDVHENHITISRYFSEKEKAVLDQHTKSGHGSRDILLTELAQGIIAEAIKYQCEHEIDTNYIFHVGTSMYSFYNRLRLTFPVICNKAKVPRQTPYTCRRSFASACIDHGINIETVKSWLGHTDARVTYASYNFDRADKAKQIAQIEQARSPGGHEFLLDLIAGKKSKS